MIASGTSTRHIKALADNVAEEARKAGFRPLGVEGERDAEWILIDLGFVICARDVANSTSFLRPRKPLACSPRRNCSLI